MKPKYYKLEEDEYLKITSEVGTISYGSGFTIEAAGKDRGKIELFSASYLSVRLSRAEEISKEEYEAKKFQLQDLIAKILNA